MLLINFTFWYRNILHTDLKVSGPFVHPLSTALLYTTAKDVE